MAFGIGALLRIIGRHLLRAQRLDAHRRVAAGGFRPASSAEHYVQDQLQERQAYDNPYNHRIA